MNIDSTYQLLINPSQEIILSFEPWLFNTEAYLNLWKSETIKFYWYNTISQKADALLFLQKSEDNVWISPLRGTFAGIDCEKIFDITDFIELLSIEIGNLNLDTVILKLTPCYFHKEHLPILNSYFTNSNVEFTELNYHFNLDESLGLLHKSKRWRLNKLLNLDYVFENQKHENLDLIHQFICNARNRKGFPMTISVEDFIQMINSIPDRYFLFTVKIKGELAAVSVCVNLGKNVFYNLYSADNERYLKDSPMILLYAGMYNYAFENHYKILDLGISTYMGIRNEGLIQFKKSLGAIETEKHILRLL